MIEEEISEGEEEVEVEEDTKKEKSDLLNFLEDMDFSKKWIKF